MAFLTYFLRLTALYAVIGVIAAVIFVICATAYVYPSQALIFAGGGIFASIIIAGIRTAHRSGFFAHLSYDQFMSFHGNRH